MTDCRSHTWSTLSHTISGANQEQEIASTKMFWAIQASRLIICGHESV